MRLLHTSDWHLGRSFHRVSLLDAQRAFLDHLVATVEERAVDAVLVSGDVYDRAVPSLAAVEMFDRTLSRLADLGVPTVMISGNHDSARRLGVGAKLLGRAGIHLRTDPRECGTPVLLEPADGGGPVAVYGVPYLEPSLVRETLGAERGGHTAVLRAATDRIRADLAGRPAGTRSVVLAHAFVTGAEVCDSERDITVGGVASVPASVFEGIDYVALGHLHNCQTLSERIRYSGTPIAYSFSEAGHPKSMWLVDLGPAGEPAAERLPCPVPRPLARLRGRLAELLEDPALEQHADSWVEATLTDAARPHDPMARLAARFPHTVSLVLAPDREEDGDARSYAVRLSGRTDRQIAEDFVGHVRPGQQAAPEEREMLGQALEAVRVAEAEPDASAAPGTARTPADGRRPSRDGARAVAR
ncbi:exonuclease SbcCD subunit D [Streptomyces sp. WMMB303]|uniref:exonuclease SbcCD subunit D n=1 Tax=Streptomyces sp. WMMB303 TaxID=3034154 RepID=UPI0023EC69BD|nr:exonuclease SbcCD subunit D [Streptomyces sp. WMMB303]MDF4249204.1 exonuclease SbcCD subunit D [Streptomyces sp. WMMB303]